MRVLLITGEGQCGVAEHGAYLAEAVQAAGVDLVVAPGEALDPRWFGKTTFAPIPNILHLNYHAALHSQWTPQVIRDLQEGSQGNIKFVVTYHDTGVPNSQQCLDLYAVADAFVVHEPCEDLPKAKYWRQGIPAAAGHLLFGERYGDLSDPYSFLGFASQPVVGSVGFPFGWKNFDLLAQGSANAGWALLLIAPGATDEDVARWKEINPYASIITEFQPRDVVVRWLSGCDATAFLYNCHNTGTSGAIRQGIAARKPVIATRFPAGRQFRDLQEDHALGKHVITWIEPSLHAITETLTRTPIGRVHPGMVRLAHRDSWAGLGQRYAGLYRELMGR